MKPVPCPICGILPLVWHPQNSLCVCEVICDNGHSALSVSSDQSELVAIADWNDNVETISQEAFAA